MKPARRRAVTLVLGVLGGGLLVAAACATTLQGSLVLVTGPDDGFAMDPKPTSLLVQLLNSQGQATAVMPRISLPTDGGVMLPPQSGANVDIIQVTGFDDAGDAVVSGSSVPLALDQLSGLSLNLFVQRTGQFSRLPSLDGGTAVLPSLPPSKPLLTTLYSRYLLIADGNGKSTSAQLYDTLTWQVFDAGLKLPKKALSLAYVDTWTGSDAAIDSGESIAALLELGPDGGAGWLDITDSVYPDAEVTMDAFAPGGQFADVAGGQTIVAPTGMIYIVGATRQTGSPTTAILRISLNGVLTWASLNTPRLGAAAAYVRNVGLYVFGGAASVDGGSKANGVEYLADDSALATIPNQSLPADPTTGAGAVGLDDQHVLLAGGVVSKGKPAPVRFITLSDLNGGGSTSGDAGGTWPALPVTFTSAQLFGLTDATSGGYSALVVGMDSSSNASAYILTPSSVTPVLFREARSHVQAIVLPNGSLGLVGGDSGTMESFIR